MFFPYLLYYVSYLYPYNGRRVFGIIDILRAPQCFIPSLLSYHLKIQFYNLGRVPIGTKNPEKNYNEAGEKTYRHLP